MSGDEVPRVSRQDIQLVQNLIERCLQLYMNQKEVVETLLGQAKIEPGFTELVWQKLEEENQEFFKAYRLRLMIKQQIIVFNKLLGRQVEMMRQLSGVPSTIPLSNGSLPSTAHMNAAYYGLQHGCMSLKEETLRHPMSSPIPNTFNNTLSSTRSSAPVYSLGREIDHSNTGGSFHEVMVKAEVAYGGTPPFVFGGDESVLDTRQDGETSGDPLVGMLEPLNDPLPLDTDPSSFGFLGQIPRNFSLSDLTADFSQSSDILESYPRSPFLHSEPDNLLDPDQGEEDKLLDTISEGLSYEELGSD